MKFGGTYNGVHLVLESYLGGKSHIIWLAIHSVPLPGSSIEGSKRQAYLEQVFIFWVFIPPHLDEAFEGIRNEVVQLSSAAELIKVWGDNQLGVVDIRFLILAWRNVQLKRYKTSSNGGFCGETCYDNMAHAITLPTRSN